MIMTIGVLYSTLPVAADGPYDAEAREIASTLACPVCQGQSVLDSQSQLAGQMRELILQKLQAGESREAIVQYFADRYGEAILLDPPKRGFTLWVWAGPVLLAGIGVALLIGTLRSRAAADPVGPGAASASGVSGALDAWLDAEVARRAAAGGVAPLRAPGPMQPQHEEESRDDGQAANVG